MKLRKVDDTLVRFGTLNVGDVCLLTHNNQAAIMHINTIGINNCNAVILTGPSTGWLILVDINQNVIPLSTELVQTKE